MRNPFRAAALLAAAVVLLAAGEAPNGDLMFLNDIEAAPTEATVEPLAFVEDVPNFPEPELGLVLPEAGSLTKLVADVRVMDAGAMDNEAECLATAVYFESKGEPLDGQLAVVQVFVNRVEDGRFGRDICAVVKAPKQFSFVKGNMLPEPTNRAAWETAKAVALIAISGSWPEIAPDATHFHATRVNPGWKNLRRIATVGQHVFYR